MSYLEVKHTPPEISVGNIKPRRGKSFGRWTNPRVSRRIHLHLTVRRACLLPTIKIQNTMMTQTSVYCLSLSLSACLQHSPCVRAPTCFVRKKRRRGRRWTDTEGRKEGGREGEGAEDDEGRWAMMQPIDGSDGDDFTFVFKVRERGRERERERETLKGRFKKKKKGRLIRLYVANDLSWHQLPKFGELLSKEQKQMKMIVIINRDLIRKCSLTLYHDVQGGVSCREDETDVIEEVTSEITALAIRN